MKTLSRILVLVLILEIILVFGQILPPHIAAPMIVVTECTALLLGGSIAIQAIKEIRKLVKSGERVYNAMEKSLADVLPPKALFMVKHEIGVFISLGRLITRKKDIPQNAVEIKYGRHMRLFITILIIAGIVEIVAVELLIPFDVPRWIVLFLSIYSLLWIVGLMAATIVYPHYATSDELVLRFFHHHTIKIPITPKCCIVVSEKSASENKTITQRDDALALNVLGTTNTTLVLPEQTKIMVDGTPTIVSSVSFNADSPKTIRNQIFGQSDPLPVGV